MKRLNANVLKYIAIIAMLIDHVGATIPIWIGDVQINQFMRLIGRTTMPIMCYFIIEGYQKTRNVKKYALRLLVFAIISEIPYRLLFPTSGSNVIFTLLAGLCALWVYDTLKEKNKLLAALSVMGICVAVTFNIPGFIKTSTDYMLLGVLAIFFGARVKPSARPILISAIIVGVLALSNAAVLFAPSDMFTISSPIRFILTNVIGFIAAGIVPAVLLYMYNGARGSKAHGYVFYVFYPLHMLAIYLVTHFEIITSIKL